MSEKMCRNKSFCIWSDTDSFCLTLQKAKVPLDDKWPVTILQLRAVALDVTISADQKAGLQRILIDLLANKNFTDENYREVRRSISRIYAGPFQKEIKEISQEVNKITAEVSKVLGRHQEDVMSVASSVDEGISQGVAPSEILGTLRMTLKEVMSKMERDTALFKHLATKDGLTGLANRRSFDSYLVSSIDSFLLKGIPVSLFLFDIDKFKEFNDQYGHLVGDQVLRHIASLVNRVMGACGREEDEWLAFRFGGDEFAIILRGASTERLFFLTDTLCTAVAKSSLLIKDSKGEVIESGLKVTISLGATKLHREWKDNYAANLISFADKALYEAKRSGRNCVGIYDIGSDEVSILESSL